jgi:hypothetical protein
MQPVNISDTGYQMFLDDESVFAPRERGLERQAKQNALARQEAVRNALAQSYNPKTGLTNYEFANQIGGVNIAPELQASQQADLLAQTELRGKQATIDKNRADAAKTYNDVVLSHLQTMGGLIGAAVDEPTYQLNKQKAASMGYDVSELPEHFDAGYVSNLQKRTLTAQQQLTMSKPDISFQTTGLGVQGYDVNAQSPTYKQPVITAPLPPKAPGTVVNVGDKGNIAATEGVVKSLINTREGLAQAPVLWQNLEDAKSLVEKAKGFMGAGGEFSLEAASFLNNRFGTNIDVEGVKNATQLRSRMFQGIVSTLKQLDSNPSQSQQAALQQALGGLGTDPNAMINVINVAQDIISRRVERYNKDATQASKKLDFPIDMPIEMPTRQAPTATGSPPPPPGFKVRTR